MKRALSLIAVLLCACGGESLPAPRDDNAIYAAAAAAEAAGSPAAGALLVVREKTVPITAEVAEDYRGRGLDTVVDREAFGAMLEASATESTLASKFTSPMELFDPSTITASAGSSEWWDAFQARYPGAYGYVSVTRIGYHEDRAVLLLTRVCGGLCGREVLYQLEHTGGAWVLEYSRVLSVF